MLFHDPPTHTVLRSLFQDSFTPPKMEAWRETIEGLADELLDAAVERGEFDVLRDLAYPLPATVIAEMLGADPADRDRFRHWSDEASPSRAWPGNPELVERAQAALLDMKDYLRTLRNLRRTDPRDDVISALAAAEEEGDRLTDDELVNTCVTLLIAGHETTTCLISSGLVTLLTQDGAAERLRREPELIEPAVEELLRFETPKQRDFRLLTEDVELHGQTMRRGQIVVQLLGAANRDPRQFDDPDAFIPDRKPNRHIAFGFGIHFCLGSPLARLEALVMLGAILRRHPGIHLTGPPPVRFDHFLVRGYRALPAALGPQAEPWSPPPSPADGSVRPLPVALGQGREA